MRLLVVVAVIFVSGFVQADVLTDPSSTQIIKLDGGLQGNPFLDSSTARANVEAAREQAKAILATAYEPSKKSELVLKTFVALRTGRIQMPPPGSDYKACTGGTLAFVLKSDRSQMYLCSTVVSDPLPLNFMAQILIHEGAHMAGYLSECVASTIEVAAMRLSGVGLQFENDYLPGCGLN